jgi:hypothetical protein
MQDWSHLWLSTTWQQSTSWTGPGMPAGAPSATAPRPNWRGGRRVQPALAEPSDLPGIASWRTPQPVSTGRGVGRLEAGAGAVKDKGPPPPP